MGFSIGFSADASVLIISGIDDEGNSLPLCHLGGWLLQNAQRGQDLRSRRPLCMTISSIDVASQRTTSSTFCVGFFR